MPFLFTNTSSIHLKILVSHLDWQSQAGFDKIQRFHCGRIKSFLTSNLIHIKIEGFDPDHHSLRFGGLIQCIILNLIQMRLGSNLKETFIYLYI